MSSKPKAEAADRRAREAAVPSPLADLPGGTRKAVAKRSGPH